MTVRKHAKLKNSVKTLEKLKTWQKLQFMTFVKYQTETCTSVVTLVTFILLTRDVQFKKWHRLWNTWQTDNFKSFKVLHFKQNLFSLKVPISSSRTSPTTATSKLCLLKTPLRTEIMMMKSNLHFLICLSISRFLFNFLLLPLSLSPPLQIDSPYCTLFVWR